MLDVTKPVQTRDGREVRILEPCIRLSKITGDAPREYMILVVKRHNGEWTSQTRFPDGSFYGPNSPSEHDIINVPAPEPVWADKPETAMTVELVRKLVPREYAAEIRDAVHKSVVRGYTDEQVLIRSKIDRLLFLAHFQPKESA